MNWKEILDIVWLTLACITFILMIIHFVKDIKQSDNYWKEMNAQLELFKTTLKKEHNLLKSVQAFDEWLDTYVTLMKTNTTLEDSSFNHGVYNGAIDIQSEFLARLGEFVGNDLSK